MAITPIPLNQFLANQNLASDLRLPWVHSSVASNLMSMVAGGKILATPCNVFKGEKLCYLFIGRPAYKTKSVDEPSVWQLPIAFVVRFPKPPPIKRIYPFDSGAFLSRRLPSYMTTFNLDGFDLARSADLVGRLVSFYFKSSERYFKRIPAGAQEIKEDHSLDMRHAEILALARLYHERSDTKFDDRAAAIELQIEQDIELRPENLLGIVMPDEYARMNDFVADIKKITPRFETYPHFPLGTPAHYGLLYEAVQRIYKAAGIPL